MMATTRNAAPVAPEIDLRHVLEIAQHRLMPPDMLVLSYRGEIVGWLNTKDRTAVLMSEPWRLRRAASAIGP